MANKSTVVKTAKEKNYARKIMVQAILRIAVCIIITVVSLFPLYIMVINGTRTSSEVTSGLSLIPGSALIDNIGTLHDPNVASGMLVRNFNIFYGYKNSLIIAGGSTILAIVFSALTAYGLTVYDFKLKKAATVFILAIMMIPTQVVSTGFFNFMVSIGLLDSYIPLILPSIASPAVVFFILQYMRSSFPLEIVEAARIDGCGELMTFVRIALPMLKPAIAVQAIFAFVASWNNYYNPKMLLSGGVEQRTIPMMVESVVNMAQFSDYGVRYLAITLSILPVIVIYLCLSKFIVKGVALGAVKG